MGGVRFAAEGVEDEDVQASEERKALCGDVAEIGEVGGRAEAVSGDGLAAVGDGNALEAGTEEGDLRAGGRGQAVEGDAGACWVAILSAEGVVENALDGSGCGVVGVEGKIAGRVEAEGAEVVHAEDVVSVPVGVEDGVDAADALADSLGVEVGAGVDDDVVGVPRDEYGGAGAAVAGVAVR